MTFIREDYGWSTEEILLGAIYFPPTKKQTLPGSKKGKTGQKVRDKNNRAIGGKHLWGGGRCPDHVIILFPFSLLPLSLYNLSFLPFFLAFSFFTFFLSTVHFFFSNERPGPLALAAATLGEEQVQKNMLSTKNAIAVSGLPEYCTIFHFPSIIRPPSQAWYLNFSR